MRWQRLVLVGVVLLVVLAMASAVGEPPRDRAGGTGTEPTEPAPAPRGDARVVTADLGERRTVRARVGDVVELRLRVREARVSIRELGVKEAIRPGETTVVRFVAVAEGRYDVLAGDARQRRVGVVRIDPARERPGGEPPEDDGGGSGDGERPRSPGDDAPLSAGEPRSATA